MEWSNDLMGKWVRVTKRLFRQKTHIGNGRYRVEWGCPIRYPPEKGMIIGRRWLKNGTLRPGTSLYEDYSPGYFTNIESVPCVVVVMNDRENPIYIPFDGFEIVDN